MPETEQGRFHETDKMVKHEQFTWIREADEVSLDFGFGNRTQYFTFAPLRRKKG